MKADEIIRIVSSEYGFTPEEIKSKRRSIMLVEARYLIADLLISERYMHKEIADMINKERSVVSYGLAQVRNWLQVDKGFRTRYIRIKDKVNVER